MPDFELVAEYKETKDKEIMIMQHTSRRETHNLLF